MVLKLIGSRRLIALVAVLLAGCLTMGEASAKPRIMAAPANDSTVGVLGSHPIHNGSRAAEPAAPVAAAPLPRVESTSPTINTPTVVSPSSSPSAAQAAPRAEVQTEGRSTTTFSSPRPPIAPAAPPSGFLVDHPVMSGLIAGLIGSDLGSMVYGGPIAGDGAAALAGFLLRVALVVFVVISIARMVWKLIKPRSSDDEWERLPERREPTFTHGNAAREGNIRREPVFRRESVVDGEMNRLHELSSHRVPSPLTAHR